MKKNSSLKNPRVGSSHTFFRVVSLEPLKA